MSPRFRFVESPHRGWKTTLSAVGFLTLVPLVLFFPALVLGKLIYGDDALGLVLPYYTEVARGLAAHQWPLWMPDLLGGMPGIASCNLMFLYPTDFIGCLGGLAPQTLLGLDAALHVALAGIGMFLFLRRLDRGPSAALLGGLFFALSGSEISQLYGGFYNFVEGLAWVPWAFWAAHKGREEGAWSAWGLCGLALALQVLAGAAQLTTYTAVALACFTLSPAWMPGPPSARSGPGKKWADSVLPGLAGLALALVLALLLASPQIWPTIQYLPLTARQSFSHAAFIRGSIGFADTLSWLVPGFNGWQEPTYHGAKSYSLTCEYLGLMPWALAAGALLALGRSDAKVRWLAGLAGLAFFFAQGWWTPFYPLVSRLPIVSGFRIWSRTLFLLSFAVCTLAAFGWDALRARATGNATLRGGFCFAGAAAASAALAWALAPAKAARDAPNLPWLWSSPASLQSAVHNLAFLARDSAWTTLALTALLAALLWFGAKRLSPVAALAFALAFHGLDQSNMVARFVHFTDPQTAVIATRFTQPPPAPPGLEPWRIYDASQDAPNKDMLLAYDNLYGGNTMPLLDAVKTTQTMRGSPGTWRRWLNVMGVRYVFSHSKQWPRLDNDVVTVSLNREAFPRAWLAGRSRRVAGDDAARRLLADPAFDPRNEVALSAEADLGGRSPRGGILWLKRSPEAFTLAVSTDEAAALVVSEFWYPSWTALVDGRECTVLKADGGLQALLLPPGRHRVDIRFDPRLFNASLVACLAGLSLLVGLFWRDATARKHPLAGDGPPALH